MILEAVPNILSLMRIPLAFFFFSENVIVRCIAVLLAMVSDGLDGYLARRYNVCSKLGTVIDPLADKFFVFFILIIFMKENRLAPWEAGSMLSRDIAALIFGSFLFMTNNFKNYQLRAFWCGKTMTSLQFIVLIGLTVHFTIPPSLYYLFIVLGVFSLLELFIRRSSQIIREG